MTCNKSSKEKSEDKCYFHFVTKVNAIYALLVGVSHNGLKVDRRQIIYDLTSSYYFKWLMFHQSYHHIHCLNGIKRERIGYKLMEEIPA